MVTSPRAPLPSSTVNVTGTISPAHCGKVRLNVCPEPVVGPPRAALASMTQSKLWIGPEEQPASSFMLHEFPGNDALKQAVTGELGGSGGGGGSGDGSGVGGGSGEGAGVGAGGVGVGGGEGLVGGGEGLRGWRGSRVRRARRRRRLGFRVPGKNGYCGHSAAGGCRDDSDDDGATDSRATADHGAHSSGTDRADDAECVEAGRHRRESCFGGPYHYFRIDVRLWI